MMKQSSITKYESYKDSGVDWLGDIPSSWELMPNKYIFRIKKNLVGKRSSEYELLSLTLKGIIKRDMENPEGKFPAEFDTYQEVKAGDFVFCLFDVEETPRTVGLSLHEGMITGAYTVFEPSKEFDKRFLYYFYLNLDGKKRLRPLYKGLRNTIPKDSFMSFKTFVPSKNEQTSIADFLDTKTAQIDEAIAIKEQQIALLKERKQIIIQKAITQGLNPNAPMKDSGVDWIGQIPAHWDVKPLTKEVYVQEGPGIMAVDFHDAGTPLVRISGVKTDTVTLEGCNYLKPSKVRQKWNHFKLKRGDLVISGSASTELVSEVEQEAEGAILYTGLIRVTPQRDSVLNEYLKIFFGTKLFFTQIDLQKTGSTISHYGPSHLSRMFIVLPSTSEQRQIVDFLKSRKSEIEEAVKLQELQIEKLKEYKTTLINSAVTGKIKVA